jgi:hypothetical protein
MMVISAGAGLWTRIARLADRTRRNRRTRDGHALEGFGLNVGFVDGPPRQIPRQIFFRQDTSPYTPQAHILTPARRRVTRQIEGLIQKVNNYG